MSRQKPLKPKYPNGIYTTNKYTERWVLSFQPHGHYYLDDTRWVKLTLGELKTLLNEMSELVRLDKVPYPLRQDSK